MDRTTALRILGLPEDARVPEIRSAYWALRDHVEARAAASSAEDRPAREAELHALDALLAAASGAPSAPDARRRRVIPRPWLAGWALLATAATVALGLALLRAPGGAGAPPVLVDGAGAGSSGTGEAFAAEIERASLVARANMDGAGLEIATALDGDTVAAGPADDTTYAVAPGDYELRVSHPDCPDEWRRHLAVVAGEHHELSPQVCADTGFLVVRSNVEGDQLSIDGERLGGTGSDRHALRAGEHQVLVEKRGYAPWRGAVEIPPAQDLTLRALLTPLEKPQPPAEPRQPPPSQSVRPEQHAALAREAENEDPHWHEEVRQWLLARYDTNLSGKLDTPEEIQNIPCSEWRGLEQSHDAAGLGVPLTRFFGFQATSEWKEDALGVDYPMRGYAYERMKECGLR